MIRRPIAAPAPAPVLLLLLLLLLGTARAFVVPAAGAAAGARATALKASAVEPLLPPIAQAASSRDAPVEEVNAALEALEKAAAEKKLTYGPSDIEGAWELVYSTQLSGGYMPVREVINFRPSTGKMEIVTDKAGFPLGQIFGKCEWRAGSEYDIYFSFERAKVFGIPIPRKTPEKGYRFFYQDGGICCARSSNGGIALLKKHE